MIKRTPQLRCAFLLHMMEKACLLLRQAQSVKKLVF